MHSCEKKEHPSGIEAERTPTPPDGGWGWMVVFSSFMICVISDGIAYTFTIFYEEFLRDFKDSRSLTSWVSSTLIGAILFIGPAASKLTKMYGCRATAMIGSVWATIGLATSTVVPNVPWLIFTAGICTGTGIGLMYLSTVVCVSFYFEKKRALATGIATSGSGIGVLLFAPFIQWMLDLMGWRSTMLVVAGLLLNCSVFGAFFRPLQKQPEKQKPTAPDVNSDDDDEHHVPHPDGFPRKSTSTADEVAFSPKGSADLEMPSKVTVLQDHQNNLFSNRQNTSEFTTVKRSPITKKLRPRKKPPPNPECPQDMYCPPMDGPVHNVAQEHKMDNSSNKRTSLSFLCRLMNTNCIVCLVRMFSLGHIKNVAFLIFCCSTFCMGIGYDVPYVYFKDRIVEFHIANDDDASYLLSVVGISSALGRLISGYLSDRTWVNRLWIFSYNIILCGLVTVLSCFFYNYSLMALYTVVFGYTAGAYMSLRSVILIDVVGLDNVASAFGFTLAFGGTACVIGPPITGWMFDYSGSYDPGYFFSGTMIALSGLMLFFIPCAQRLQQSRDQKVVTARTNSSLDQSTTTNISVI